jgi:hypothetical protein
MYETFLFSSTFLIYHLLKGNNCILVSSVLHNLLSQSFHNSNTIGSHKILTESPGFNILLKLYSKLKEGKDKFI